jgi:hypothetical protein
VAAHAEQKTMMAGDMQAPVINRPPPSASSGPPPAASSGPPPAAFSGPPPAAPVSEQKTMMADMPAPVINRAQAQPQGTPLSNQRTMAVSAPSNLPHGSGTQMLPDSQGVVAFARDKAVEARQPGGPATIPAPPASPLFWIAWVVLGIGLGLGVHFWLAHKAGLIG